MKVVLVRWVESMKTEGWITKADAENFVVSNEGAAIETVGFLVYDNEQAVGVGQSKTDQGRVESLVRIPQRSITHIEVINE